MLWVGTGMLGNSSRDGAMGGCRGELRSAPPYKKDWAKPLILGVQGAALPFWGRTSSRVTSRHLR